MKKITFGIVVAVLEILGSCQNRPAYATTAVMENVRGTNNAYYINTTSSYTVIGSTIQASTATLTVAGNINATCIQFANGFQCSPIPSTGTLNNQFIQNTSTLQSGATFFVSSGTCVNFTATASTMTSLNVTNLNYLQKQIQVSITASSNTTTNTYINSALSASITPTSASSRVRITVTAALRTANAGAADVLATIRRGGTDLSPGALGFVIADSTLTATVPMTWIDSPATTSQVTYFASFRNDDNATQVFFGGSGATSVMQLQEIP